MWSTVESGGADRAAPCARGKHSATLLGGHVYVLGGRGAGGCVPLRDFWRYSLASGRWERLEARGEPPPALQEHSATAHGIRLYVFGGEAGSLSNETPLWIYDTEAQSWRKLSAGAGAVREARGAAPRGRRGHSAHALKDCLLIYGGYKDLRGSTNELWAFHYESAGWQQVRTAGAGPARHRHAAALHDNRLYVHGGQCDLRAAADLWHYDTLSRAWSAVRTPPKLSPSARCGHAGLRAGAHFYIFGGEVNGHPTNELWRFHFATETWERVSHGAHWPAARVDARALLVRGAGRGEGRDADGARADRDELAAPAGRHEPSAGFLREISKLSGLRRRRAARCAYTVLAAERDSTESLPLAKSRSAHAFDERQPADGREAPPSPRRELAHEPLSVPDLAAAAPAPTSDYASAERVHSAGFANPHYLGPDVRALGCALTPDSGLGPGDIELQELGERPARPARLHLLLVGGREPSHPALLQRPLAMWTFKLL